MFLHAGYSRLGEFGLIIRTEKSLSIVSQSLTGFRVAEVKFSFF